MTDDCVQVQVTNHFSIAEETLDRALLRSEARLAVAIAASLDETHAAWIELFDRFATTLESLIVSKLTDKLDAIEKSVDAAIGRVQDDVTALNTKVADLQKLVDSGGATPEDIARMDALQARVDAIDPVKPDVLPPEGGEPTPAPEPVPTPEPAPPPTDVTPPPPTDVTPPPTDMPVAPEPAPTPEPAPEPTPTPEPAPPPVDTNAPDGTP